MTLCTAFRPRHRALILTLATLGVSACAAPETRSAEPTALQTEVYFYPGRGQSSAQQDRDRYECYVWAKKQTGFDPSAPYLAPHQRFAVVSQPAPGQDVAAGAVTGAVIGAVAARPGHAAEGAIVGSVAGAAVGAVAESARTKQAERASTKITNARIEQQAANYRRALTACLEGRGYTVR